MRSHELIHYYILSLTKLMSGRIKSEALKKTSFFADVHDVFILTLNHLLHKQAGLRQQCDRVINTKIKSYLRISTASDYLGPR